MYVNVRLEHAAEDEDGQSSSGGNKAIRGVILPACLSLLKVDGYQRQAMPINHRLIKNLETAYREGRLVPDITLGMRGENYEIDGDSAVLKSALFIIDGLQRVTAAMQAMRSGAMPHVGVIVYCNTSRESEMYLFKTLNQERLGVAPAVLLRNLQDENPAVAALRRMCDPKTSTLPIAGRVGWDQLSSKSDLFTGVVVAKAAGAVGNRFGGFRSRSRVDEVAAALLTYFNTVGERAFVSNTAAVFNLVNAAFDFSRVHNRKGNAFIRGNFLTTLGLFLSMHDDFWSGNYMQTKDPKIVSKLSKFNLTDSDVSGLCSSGFGPATNLLYAMLGTHFSSGVGFKIKHWQPMAISSGDLEAN